MRVKHQIWLLLLFLQLFGRVLYVRSAYFSQFSMRKPAYDPCYDSSGRSQRCVPDFINAVLFCNILFMGHYFGDSLRHLENQLLHRARAEPTDPQSELFKTKLISIHLYERCWLNFWLKFLAADILPQYNSRNFILYSVIDGRFTSSWKFMFLHLLMSSSLGRFETWLVGPSNGQLNN